MSEERSWGSEPRSEPIEVKHRSKAFRGGFFGCLGVLVAVVVVTVVAVALAGSGGSKTGDVAVTATTEHVTSMATQASATTTAPITTAKPKSTPVSEFGEGIYRVGTDIQPGLYKATITSGMGYWARLRSEDTVDIIANDGKSSGTMYLRVRSSDKYIEISGATFRKVD